MYQIIYFWFFMKYDSPKWYLDNNKLQEAKNALLLIYTEQSLDKGLSRFSQDVEMQAGENIDSKKLLTFKDIFKDRKYRKMLRIGFMLGMLQQLSGICANIFYSTATFKNIGGSTFMARIYTVIMGVVNFIAGIFTIPLLKKFGRKTLMLSGSAFIAIDCFILGIFSGIIDASLIIPLLCIYFFMINFSYSLGATLWTYLAEVCVDKILTVAAASNLFFTCVVTISFPYVASSLGVSFAFFFFSASMALTVGYFYWDLVETKGKTKPEIMNLVLNK
ncbi:hypothetical protein SteCoe_31917 [Stentor coeruleus]|uniref:Major facilitator superfamily (MFS) profile domain-containing protein n=1 Tax=Stentor coeruleus TaxID=5963 RepID=A0A1R2B0L8_9CILI|nr:hypothetical protein SteCoe_31917 [Stentor coeruleus]